MPTPRKRIPKKPVGRPDLLTETRLDKIEQAVRGGSTREDAARYAGIGASTLYEWLAEGRHLTANPPKVPAARDRLLMELAERLERADGSMAVLMVGRVIQAANSGTWQAAAWWLERRRSDDYGRKDFLRSESKVEVESDVDVREVLRDRIARLVPLGAEPDEHPSET